MAFKNLDKFMKNGNEGPLEFLENFFKNFGQKNKWGPLETIFHFWNFRGAGPVGATIMLYIRLCVCVLNNC